MHVTLFTVLSFCLHKNVKRGGLFVQDYPKTILRRFDPKRYGISSALTELQSSTIDFLLVSVAAEFSLRLFSSTSLPRVLTSSFTAILGHLCTGERTWPREWPFTRRGHGDEVTTAKKGPKGARCVALGTTPTLVQKQEQMLLVNGPNWASWTSLVATTLSAAPAKQKPACFFPQSRLSSGHWLWP